MEKKYIKNLSLDETENLFKVLQINPERAKELFTWIYEKNTADFHEINIFPLKIRKFLAENYELSPLVAEKVQQSSDGTIKILLKTEDDLYIETVLIPNRQKSKIRYTVCISSQAGCAMGCSFCQTAKTGFKRNLQTAEILDQINHIRRISGIKNNNVVFMGMGEPFNNYDSVIKAAEIMNYTFGFHLSNYKITVSTCGIFDGIRKFVEQKKPFNLAISLNDTDMEKRRLNMPVEKKYPFSEIINYLKIHLPSSKNRVLIEYIMRADNISESDALRLKEIIFSEKILLNCIVLNQGDHNFQIPDSSAVELFLQYLDNLKITYTLRESYGSDISAACGQLSASILQHNHKKPFQKATV
ncbi:MAG: 23S rRNA (adenine(2503)-C(2))-methyltransferase RlmN [Spirochaetes bacterium]|nr:23S rRNA (adenine(2503)-C(2))-methyltransferase RlmN [Spirochaetota bacterium]